MATQLNRAVLIISLLALVGLVAAACGGAPALKDTGPNAHLSNVDLLKMAAENMQALESFHLEFNGGIPDDHVKMSTNTTISADIQLNSKGIRAKVGDGINSVEYISPEGERPYLSYDGGKTWTQYGVDTPTDWLLAIFATVWSENGIDIDEQMLSDLTLRDGSPSVEIIDGTPTRHLVSTMTEFKNLSGPNLFTGGETISFWVSTDITPTVRQMKMQGSNVVTHNMSGYAADLAFSPDGRILAVGHNDIVDASLRLWNPTGSRTVPDKRLGSDRGVNSVAFSPDGKILAVGYQGGPPGEVRLWSMDDLATPLAVFPVSIAVSSVAFRPDGQMLAAVGSGDVYLWSEPFKNAQGSVIKGVDDASLAGSERTITSVAFSPDNRTLAWADLYTGVWVFSLSEPDAAPTFLAQQWVEDIAFSPDGHFIAAISKRSGLETDGLRVWDLRQATPNFTTPGGEEVSGSALAFSPDGKLLAVGGGSSVILWKVDDLSSQPIIYGQGGLLSDETFSTNSVAFNPDSGTLAAANSVGEVRVYDISKPNASPTLLREDEQRKDTPYTLTWKWSRFNEDFGVVEPPPAETIKSPYAP